MPRVKARARCGRMRGRTALPLLRRARGTLRRCRGLSPAVKAGARSGSFVHDAGDVRRGAQRSIRRRRCCCGEVRKWKWLVGQVWWCWGRRTEPTALAKLLARFGPSARDATRFEHTSLAPCSIGRRQGRTHVATILPYPSQCLAWHPEPDPVRLSPLRRPLPPCRPAASSRPPRTLAAPSGPDSPAAAAPPRRVSSCRVSKCS